MANTHSLDLEGTSSQYASITDASQSGLDITGDLSVECWVNFEELIGPDVIVSKSDTANNNSSFIMQTTGGEALRIRIFSTGALTPTTDYTADTAFADPGDIGVWIHLAFTFDASAAEVVMYRDGTVFPSTSSATASTSIYNGTSAFAVGAQYVTGAAASFYYGKVDEVRVWDDIRTITEIADNKDVELAGTEANLQGYWRFNNDYTDETSNSNDLTASGSPVFSTDVPFTSEITRALVDAMGISDTVVPVTNYERALINSVGLTDILNAGLLVSRELVDAVGMTDSDDVNIAITFGVNLSDSMGITDALDKVNTYSRSIVDSEGLTDVLESQFTYNRSVTDSMGITDVLNAGILISRSLADSIGVTEALTVAERILKQSILKLEEILDIKVTFEDIQDIKVELEEIDNK